MVRASSVVPYGASSDGLRIVGAPAARAEATLWAAIGAGAFHGTRHTAGPRGSRCTSTAWPAGPVLVSRRTPVRSISAASRKAPGTITPTIEVWEIGTPVAKASRAANRGTSPSSAVADRVEHLGPALGGKAGPAGLGVHRVGRGERRVDRRRGAGGRHAGRRAAVRVLEHQVEPVTRRGPGAGDQLVDLGQRPQADCAPMPAGADVPGTVDVVISRSCRAW